VKVILLGMGGRITTLAVVSLCEMAEVELLAIVCPKSRKGKVPMLKRLMLNMPSFIQNSIRKIRVRFFKKEYWQLPDVCLKYNIEVVKFSNINNEEATHYLKSTNCDLIVIANYNQILKPHILEIPQYATINIHPSLLPAYRGANPIFWMFKNNETRGGVTIHIVDKSIDTGAILTQDSFLLGRTESVYSYTLKCALKASASLKSIITNLSVNKTLVFTNQLDSGVSSYPKPKSEDGEVLVLDDLKLMVRNIKAMKTYLRPFIIIQSQRFVINSFSLKKGRRKPSMSENRVVISSNGQCLTLKGFIEDGKI